MENKAPSDKIPAPRKRNLGGRPKADNPGDNKTRVIQIAVSEKELANLKKEILSTGTNMSVSTFLHKRLIEQQLTFKKVNILGTDTYLAMNKVGVNINQIAYQLNTGKYDVSEGLILELKSLYQQHIDLILETLKGIQN